MNIRSLFHIPRYGFRQSSEKITSISTSSLFRQEFGESPERILEANQLRDFVLSLKTKEINTRDLNSLTTIFKMWNEIVVSKTDETKSAAAHEIIQLIANCDPLIKMETNYLCDFKSREEHFRGVIDYAMFEVPLQYPFFATYFKEKIPSFLHMSKACRAYSLRHGFSRTYALITNLDEWIFIMYSHEANLNSNITSYVHKLDLQNVDNLKNNLEKIMQHGYAFINHGFKEYKIQNQVVSQVILG